MRKAIYQSAVYLLALAGLIIGRLVSFPDNVHTVHGFPLTWGVHQMVTIVGPVDSWRVNLVNLSIDLMFWFLLVTLVPLLLDKISRDINRQID